MSTASVIVAVIGAGASPDVERFLDVLHALPDIRHRESGPVALPSPGPPAMSIMEAFFSVTEVVPARDAIGRVTADTLSAYPPGIPNLMAGEVVTPEAIEFLQATIRVPFGHLRGGVSSDMSHIRVTI
jgi:arginine decarboxylase